MPLFAYIIGGGVFLTSIGVIVPSILRLRKSAKNSVFKSTPEKFNDNSKGVQCLV